MTHRVTGDSKRGRQLRAMTGRIERGSGPTPEQQAWNERVERERQERKEKRRLRRG